MTRVSPDEYIRHPSLAVGGSPEQFREDPVCLPALPLLLSPQRLRPHCSPWTAGEPFGEVLGHWPLTIFFGVTTILGNISLHCNYMCIFKYAKVLTLSLTQLGSHGNLEKIPFGEVLGWRIWSGGGPSCARKYTVGRKNFHWCLIQIWHFYSKVFPLEVTQRFPWFCSAECLFAQSNPLFGLTWIWNKILS